LSVHARSICPEETAVALKDVGATGRLAGVVAAAEFEYELPAVLNA
jgi:hypothetical protein